MGRTEYLIDTNVAIDYIGGALPSKALDMLDDIIDEQFYLSVINKIELLGFEGISETFHLPPFTKPSTQQINNSTIEQITILD